MTSKVCPHCGHDVKEPWHQHYGVQRLEQGSGQIGVPVVGSLKMNRERLVMVYVCGLTNLPFLVAVGKAKDR